MVSALCSCPCGYIAAGKPGASHTSFHSYSSNSRSSSSRRMKKTNFIFCLLLVISASGAERKIDPLPVAVSGNAVAAAKMEKTIYLYSFMGIGQKGTWDAVTNQAFSMNADTGKWAELKPVPGPAGRID